VDGNQRKIIAKITSNRGLHYIEIPGNGDKKVPVKDIASIVALNKPIIEVAKGFLID